MIGWLFLTLLGYQAGVWLRRRTDGHGLAQPALVAIVVVAIGVVVSGTDYADYARDTELISFWLGPATVALAVPLHRQLRRLRQMWLPILVALPAGAFVSIAVGYTLVAQLGGSEQLARTVAPKSATTPVSIAVSASIHGIPALTAVITILIGIVGAVIGPAVLHRLGVRDHTARGLALGAVSHGIGTSRALHDHPVEGAFSGLAMGLTALATSLLTPLVLWLFG